MLWLAAVEQFKDNDYLVFENERYTYAQAHEKASRLASLLYTKYGVRKGDRGKFRSNNQVIHYLLTVSAIRTQSQSSCETSPSS